MTRTKLCDRILPDYTRGEEIFNMVSPSWVPPSALWH